MTGSGISEKTEFPISILSSRLNRICDYSHLEVKLHINGQQSWWYESKVRLGKISDDLR